MGDMVRGIVAVLVALFLLMITPVGSFVFLGLALLLVLFALYLGGTVSRWKSIVAVDDQGLRVTGGVLGRRTIVWADLQRFELRHFPLSRDRKTGYMDLKLKTATASVSIDDKLDRFHELLARAFEAARKAEVGLSDVTHANLAAAGIIAKPKA